MNVRQSFQKGRPLAKAAIVFAMTAVVTGARAAGPLDFGYSVEGPPTVRPTLVFNDGQDTYIQPAQGIPTTVKGSVQDGPYLRVPGLSASISVRAGRYSMTATHTTLPSTPPETPSYQGAPLQAEASGLADEMSPHQGRHRDQDGRSFPPLLGKSDGDNTAAREVTVAGQQAAGLVAGPVISTPSAVAMSVEMSANRIANSLTAATPTSLLATQFGATAIRDSDPSHTQIRFAQKPIAELSFTAADGRSLNPSWDYGTRVVTIDRADRFNVTDGRSVVEVARVATSSFDFEVGNPAQLEAVFTKNGATYFKFSSSAKHVRVVDATHTARGEQKGRYYKVAEVGDQFTVTAAGKSITVNRKEAVAYYDRPGKQS